jgi:signal transduction histidine kinase/CheY-like chemotaxis protein
MRQGGPHVKLQILHLEDNRDDVELVRHNLARGGLEFELHAVESASDYLSALDEKRYDVILSDSGLPGYDSRAALLAAQARSPSTPFIVVSAADSGLAGSAAFVSKTDVTQLAEVIQRTCQNAQDPPQHSARYVRGMQHLVGVVQRLSMARDLDSITAIVRRAARELTGADGASFVLRDADKCYYLDEDAIGPLWKGQRFPLTACISGWAMLNRQAAAIEDIYRDPRIPHDAYRSTFVKSLVMMPIRSESPIGAIGVYWKDTRQALAEEVSLLQALADSTSIALEAADLFANLERRVEQRTAELHQRTTELEVVNRELEAFSYSVAHDLRSPLITIDGFCQILQETCAPRLTEEDRSHLDRIDQAVIRMRRLIEDLMGLAKIVRAPMQRVQVDLTMIATEVIGELRATGAPRSADIIIAPYLLANGDPGLLRVVLSNLLGNAWKFTSKKPTARIELGMKHDAQKNDIYFVRDNGAGFDPGFADRMFSPFSRCHSQQEFPGTGIGLATVQRVIHRHGGQIWAEAQVDRGATFYFTLPRG